MCLMQLKTECVGSEKIVVNVHCCTDDEDCYGAQWKVGEGDGGVGHWW